MIGNGWVLLDNGNNIVTFGAQPFDYVPVNVFIRNQFHVALDAG